MPSSIGNESGDRVDGASNVADYFLEIGLPDDLSPEKETSSSRRPPVQYPITEISLIFPSQGEGVPEGWEWLRYSPNGHLADLNTNALRGQSVYLIYKRAKTFSLDERPLTDLGILYEGRENLRPDCEQLYQSFYGRPGFVNTKSAVGGQRTYITFRRRHATDPLPILAITDIAVYFPKKGDVIPHSFIVVSKNINKGSVTAAEVYLCYKKSIIQPPSLIFEPTLISRYPLMNQDAKHFSLTLIEKDCANIAMPNGASVQYWSFNAANKTVALPQFSTFVLTNHLGVTMYGSALTFYEEFSTSELSPEQKRDLKSLCSEPDDESDNLDPRAILQSEKCICLLSQKPLFPAFKEFLTFLFSFCSTPGDRGPIPVEQLISYFMYDVCCPSPEKPLIIVDLGARKLNLSWPSPCSSLPQKGSSFITFLRNVGVDMAIDLFTLVLLESTIVFHSLRPSVLTTVMETLVAAVFPLKWTGTYIPSCARQMVTSAECPGCAMIGIDSRTYDALDDYDLISPEGSKQICFVDLDTTQIKMSEVKRTFKAEKLLPKKAYKCLKKTLGDCHREIDGKPEIYGHRGGELAATTESDASRKKIYVMELRCQEAFLKFMAIVMKGYQNFLRDSTSDDSSAKQSAFQNFDDLFDLNEFIRSQKSSKQFYQEFCNTHSFAHFIHLRSHSSNQNNTTTIANLDYNVFFDECIEKMANEQEDSRLLEVDKSLLVEHCQFITPPEPTDPSVSYDYSGIFPKLDMKLFGPSNFCSSGNTSANASVMSTPVHGRDFNKSGSSHAITGKVLLWRTPAENKGAQRNARILFEMMSKALNKGIIATSSTGNHAEGDVDGSSSVSKLWVKHLMMNCYTMWFMLLPANLSLKSGETEVAEQLKAAERILNSVLGKFVKPTNAQRQDDLNSSLLTTVAAAAGNLSKQPNVLPEEVIYRVLIFSYHKYRMIKNIYNLQQTLKQHGVKLNAATYMYLNSMLLNAASLSNEQGPTKTRSRVRIHWVMVRCTAKFIILWRKKHGMSGTEAQENAESKELLPFSPEQTTGSNAYVRDASEPCGDRPCDLDIADANTSSELIEMSPVSKVETGHEANLETEEVEEGAKALDLLEHKTLSASQIKRRSLHGIPQMHSVNRKLFSNSQTSLNTSEHEHPINVGTSFVKNKQRFNSLDDHLEAKLNTCEHSASNESCRIQNATGVDLVRENDAAATEPLTSSAVDGLNKLIEVKMEATVESVDDIDKGNKNKSTEELLNVTQETNSSSHDNRDEKDNQRKVLQNHSTFDLIPADDISEQHMEPRLLGLPRSESTASSLDEGSSKTEQHRLAAMILGKMIKASDSLQNLTKQSFAGSTSTLSEDRASCSSNLASQATSIGFGLERDKKSSNESLLTSAANYTQKVFQNPKVTRLRDQVQQVAQEMMYAVTIDASLEPDVSSSMKSNSTPKKNNTNVSAKRNVPPPSLEKVPQRPVISSSAYEGRFRKKQVSSLVNVHITSVYTCISASCKKTLYDEEIMAQWNHDDSSFSITCPCKTSQTGTGSYQTCGYSQLPKLTVVIKDYRHQYYECGCEECLKALKKFSPDWLHEVESIAQAQKSRVSTSNFSPVLGTRQNAGESRKDKSTAPNGTSWNSLNDFGDANTRTNQRGLDEILEVSGAAGSFQSSEKGDFEVDQNVNQAQTAADVGNNCDEEQTDSGLINSTATPLLRSRRSCHRRYPSAPPMPPSTGVETWSLPGGINCRRASGSSTSQLSLQNASSSNLDEHSMASRGQPVLETIGDNASTSSSSHTTPGLRHVDKKLSPPHEIGPILINYLSPLVVRKALERLIDNSGGSDEILSSGEMVDEKMDIYWNLVWYFSRLELKTHLSDLLLKSRLLNSSNPLTSAVPLERQASASSSALAVESEDSISVSSMLSNTVKMNSMSNQTKNLSSHLPHPSIGPDPVVTLLPTRKCLRHTEKQIKSSCAESGTPMDDQITCGVHVTTLWDKLIRSPEQRWRKRSSTFCEEDNDRSGDVSWEVEAPLYLSWLKSEEPRLDKLDISVTWLPDRWKPEFAKHTFDAIFREREMDAVIQEVLMYLTRSRPSVDLAPNPNRRGIHREMLFTAISALNSKRINIDAFFSSYNEAYLKIKEQTYYQSKMHIQDIPLSQLAVDFASCFGGLQI